MQYHITLQIFSVGECGSEGTVSKMETVPNEGFLQYQKKIDRKKGETQ